MMELIIMVFTTTFNARLAREQIYKIDKLGKRAIFTETRHG
jgi:hypothetical protein